MEDNKKTPLDINAINNYIQMSNNFDQIFNPNSGIFIIPESYVSKNNFNIKSLNHNQKIIHIYEKE
jgi:hypothetical protein